MQDLGSLFWPALLVPASAAVRRSYSSELAVSSCGDVDEVCVCFEHDSGLAPP